MKRACILVSLLLAPFASRGFAQDLVYANQVVAVYDVPNGLSPTNAESRARRIAADLAREGIIELAGEAVTVFAGSIAGLLYSVIQNIPTVGNPSHLAFDIIPENISRGYSKFNLCIFFEKGEWQGAWRGFSVTLERRTRLLRWETIESHQLLNDNEAFNLPWRSLIVLKQPLIAPNEFGTYRISVAGRRKEFRITEVTH